MDEGNLINTLVDADILSLTDDDELSLSETFREAIDHRQSDIRPDDLEPKELNRMLSASNIKFTDLDDVPKASLAILLELDRHDVALSTDEVRRSLLIVDQLYRGVPRADGSPELFFPIRGDQMKLCTDLFPASIVYVWLEDCDPCDLIREDLEKIFPEPPDDFALFSVYGPEWSRLLHESYNVEGGPVILFMLGDRVDTRFTGAYGTTAIENEVKTFREIVQSRFAR